MPIKQFPPPAFLPDADWQRSGNGLNAVWRLFAELNSKGDGWYGEDVTYLVLIYGAGVYRLHLRVVNEYSSPSSYDPFVGSSQKSDTVLWQGEYPNYAELNQIISSYTDEKLDDIFASDDYIDAMEWGNCPDEDYDLG